MKNVIEQFLSSKAARNSTALAALVSATGVGQPWAG